MRQVFISLFAVLMFSPLINAQDASSIPENEKEYQIQYDKNIRKSRINGVYIPKDINDVFRELNMLSPAESINKFRNADEELIKSKLHFGLGRWMIENWNFYGGSRISHQLKEMGISFPDDMAKFLIVSYHRYLNKKPLELEERALVYYNNRLEEQLQRENEGTIIKEEKRIRNDKGKGN